MSSKSKGIFSDGGQLWDFFSSDMHRGQKLYWYDPAHASWVGSVLRVYGSCTTSHNGRLGSTRSRSWSIRSDLICLRPNGYGTTMLIPPIFPFLPTYSDFTRGTLKTRQFSRKKLFELSSRGLINYFQRAFPIVQGGRKSFLRRDKIHPDFLNSRYLLYICPKDSEKVSFYAILCYCYIVGETWNELL